jgi:RimJ/RimL family protein N-acetyltransferase
MPELHPAGYASVRPLVPPSHDAGHMTFAHAVLDGTLPARVFVDDVAAPRTALICPDCGFFLALGAPSAGFVDALVPELARDSVDRPNEASLIVASTPAWEAALDGVLRTKERRNEYHYEPRGTSAPRLSGGLRLEPIDEGIARQFGFGIDPWVIRTWGGPAGFVARSFGLAVMAGDELAAICAACALGGGEAEIEIATDPRYRRRGLAVAAGEAFIAECSRRGLVPAWTCASRNEPSVRSAARLGFVQFRDVACYPLRPYLERINGRWEIPERG